jgi:hypothetical protein
MKIITAFDPLTTLTALNSDTEFPVANLKDFLPWKRWWATGYADGIVWVLVDRGAGASTIDSVYLGNANFPQCRLQLNDANVWTSPSVNILANLVKDDIGNRKGFFNLGANSLRYFRLSIASGQTLDVGAPTFPALGALVLGLAGTLPVVAEASTRTMRPYSRAVTVSGRLRKWRAGDGKGRHVVRLSMGDDWAPIRNFSLDWDMAAIAADLGDAGDAWLVYGADEAEKNAKFIEEADGSLTLEEVG